MAHLIPYIAFPGNCKEALSFYAEVLGGEITSISTFKDSPIDVSEEDQDRIFDSELIAGDIKIKASDNLTGHSIETGNSISLFVSFKDLKLREKAFNALAENGQIMFELDDNFGMLKDKFGIQWMFVPAN